MISIIKKHNCKKIKSSDSYALYINETHKIDFEHVREPEDLSRLLRDAAEAIDLKNGVTQPKQPKKLSMMERLNGVKSHLEKQELDY